MLGRSVPAAACAGTLAGLTLCCSGRLGNGGLRGAVRHGRAPLMVRNRGYEVTLAHPGTAGDTELTGERLKLRQLKAGQSTALGRCCIS
ncbi:hypothetical protein QMG52_14250 [Paenarthrobacter sp. PH39-S1]|nr:hypothetical protein [Paenarthrobacter sp. PH39-S1]